MREMNNSVILLLEGCYGILKIRVANRKLPTCKILFSSFFAFKEAQLKDATQKMYWLPF